METKRKIVLVVDARCYQDDNYALRGIGRSTMSLLRNCPREHRDGMTFHAVVDPRLPAMRPHLAKAFDAEGQAPPSLAGPAIFFNPSPLTHDGRRVTELVRNPLVYPIAFVHDFIPYDFPSEFGDVGGYVDYHFSLKELANYRCFAANSEFTARRAREILNIPQDRIFVSRIAAREAFFDRTAVPPAEETAMIREATSGGNGFFVAVCGDSPRKNVECAIWGLNLLNERSGAAYRLIVIGRYSSRNRERLRAFSPANVVFIDQIADATLARLYREAIATVQPSRVEGYSMPVVETIASGGLVLASDCDAHREFVKMPEALFSAAKPEELAERMRAVAENPAVRARIISEQAPSAAGLTESKVAGDFWRHVMKGFFPFVPSAGRARNAGRADRPTFAFVSPYVPQRSGVAIGMQRALVHLARTATVDLYTHADVDPRGHRYLRSVRRFDEALKKEPACDAVVYVLGNCNFHHGPIYDLAINHRQGDFVLLADSVMINMQYDHRGRDGAAEYAGGILKRRVNPVEFESWLGRPALSPILGQEEFLDGGWRPIVHSRVTQAVIRERTGIEARWIPHPVTMRVEDSDFLPAVRKKWRDLMKCSDNDIVVAIAGGVSEVKGSFESICALRELVDWGRNVRFVFVGGADENLRTRLIGLAAALGVAHRVDFVEYPREEDYRFYLIAADVGLQLRKVPFGQTSGGLADCIAAGLPTVANESMAAAVDAPGYVYTVPDVLSPVLVAEKILEAIESPVGAGCDSEERREYLSSHSAEVFARYLMELAGAGARPERLPYQDLPLQDGSKV